MIAYFAGEGNDGFRFFEKIPNFSGLSRLKGIPDEIPMELYIFFLQKAI